MRSFKICPLIGPYSVPHMYTSDPSHRHSKSHLKPRAADSNNFTLLQNFGNCLDHFITDVIRGHLAQLRGPEKVMRELQQQIGSR